MRKVVVLAFLSLNLLAYSSDITKLRFDHITSDDGLTSNSIERIYQDSKGFIWIATRDGLNRFDGINFISFRFDRADSNSIASAWVIDILEDSENNIWIGSLEGLNIFYPETGKMTRVQPRPDDPDAYRGGRVYDIEMDYDKSIWLATDLGLVHYNPKTKKYKTYQAEPGKPNALPINTIYSILLTADESLYVAPNSDPIYKFNRDKEDFTEIPYKQKFFNSNYEKTLTEIEDNIIYIASEGAGIHIYNLLTKAVKLIDVAPGQLNVPTIKSSPLKISKDQIWIGTDGDGVNIYNPLTGTMQYMRFDAKDPYSISSGGVFDMIEDMHGNIWIGHYGTGISLWRKYKEKFKAYTPNPQISSAINNGVVTASFEDSQGRIWIGLDGGGLELFNPATGEFTHYRYNPEGNSALASNVIICIEEDDYGNLLLGTYQQGVMVFNPEKGRMIHQVNTKNGLSYNNIWDIYKGSDGMFYFASLGQGIDILNPLDSTFKYINGGGTGIGSVPMFITGDDIGNLWIGTEGQGFSIYNLKTDEYKSFRVDPKNLNSLSNNDVKTIVFIDSVAWIATNGGGLNRFDLKTQNFRVFTTQNGLPSNALMGILLDSKKNLWISTTKGLAKFNPVTEEIVVYDPSQGLQGSEFKYNSQYRLSDGRMIFGGTNGINIFHPDSIKPSPIKAQVLLTQLKIMNEVVKVGDKGSPLKQDINHTKRLKLRHKHRIFTISFVSLDYTNPTKNKVKYKLEGFDEKWNVADGINSVTYTNLNAKTYTFRLIGSNSDGVFNSDEKVIKIRVRPPFYRTKIFILLLIVLVVYAIYYYIKQREAQAKHDKQMLQQRIDEGEAKLHSKELEIEKRKAEFEERTQREYQIHFQHEGVSRFSEIIAKNRQNLEGLSTAIISELVNYTHANAGAIYIADDSDPAHIMLRASGQFCFDSDAEKKYEFESGEGYIGTCHVHKKIIQLNDLPDGYIKLRSGLGETSMRHDLLVPVIQEETCLGVIEIASFEALEPYIVEFISKIADNMASVVAITRANERTQEMLEQNRMQSEELMAQEEEMRQNIEEMQATQEDLKRQIEENERFRAELSKEKALIDTLLNYAREKIYFKDIESRFIKVSKSMIEQFKCKSVEELYGKTDFDFFTEEHAKPAFDDEMNIIKTGKPMLDKIEKETHNDGTITYVSTSKMPLYNEKGDIIGTFGISKDITEAILMQEEVKIRNEELLAQEEELRQNLEEMQSIQENLQNEIELNKKMQDELTKEKYLTDALMNTIPESIYFKDLESKFIKNSKSHAQLFGFEDPKELIGKSDFDFFDEKHAKPAFEDEQKIIKTKVPIINLVEEELKKDGTLAYVSTTKMPLLNEKNEVVGTFGISRNITEFMNKEFEIKKLAKELQERETELKKQVEEKNQQIKELQQKLKK